MTLKSDHSENLSEFYRLKRLTLGSHTQTENAVWDEAVVEQLSMKINDIQTSIRTLHSQIKNAHGTDYLNQDLGLPLSVVNLADLADELSTCAVRHWKLVANTSFLQEDRCDQACSLFYTILEMIQNMSDLSLGIYKPMPIASSGKYMRQKKSSIHYWELYERQKILFCFLQNIVSPGWH